MPVVISSENRDQPRVSRKTVGAGEDSGSSRGRSRMAFEIPAENLRIMGDFVGDSGMVPAGNLGRSWQF